MEARNKEKSVVVHTAGTMAEAMVIRALLESAGIRSPGSISSDPFPLRESPEGTHGEEIVVMESEADLAKEIIAEYLKAGASGVGDDSVDAANSESES
jgi:hypothetical protein